MTLEGSLRAVFSVAMEFAQMSVAILTEQTPSAEEDHETLLKALEKLRLVDHEMRLSC